MCHLFDHICSDCYYAAPVWEPSHQTLILKLWRRTDLVHTIDELLINSKIPTFKERRPLLKWSYLFHVQDKWALLISKHSPHPASNSWETQNLSCYIFRETACTNKCIHIIIFSTSYLLIRNNFTPLIVIIIICRCLIISWLCCSIMGT